MSIGNQHPLILYEDNHILAAVKEPGILSQEDISGKADMVNLIKDYLAVSRSKPGNVWLGLLHRLDQPASGVMVFALTSKAAGRMSKAFRENLIGKYYLALVHGIPDQPAATLTDYISYEKREGRYFITSKEEGRPATLEYRVVLTFKTDKTVLSLLLIRLITGRPHQIRVQFSGRQHPLLGDRRYGPDSLLDQKVPTLALHSYMLDFLHPVKRNRMVVKAPLFLDGKAINPSFATIRDALDYGKIDSYIDEMSREVSKLT